MPSFSPICVDASIVVRFVSARRDEPIQALWGGWAAERREFVAPTLLRYEVTNALHRLRQAGETSVGATSDALRAALRIPIRYYDDFDLHAAALALAARFGLLAAYDSHYLALTERLGAEFWTADRRLANAVSRALPWVHLVG